jgi:hypothetical protein
MEWLATAAVLAFALVGVIYVLWRRRRKAAENLARIEAQLRAAPTEANPGESYFHPVLLAELPEPAARYLQWSLADGTPVRRGVHLNMTGRIRLGRQRPWLPLRCEELYHADRGFVWKATTRNLLRICGFDRHYKAEGEMYWTLYGLIPVMRATGPDISRSSLDRFVAERMLAPASLLPSPDVEWKDQSKNGVNLRVRAHGRWQEFLLTVDPDGMPRKLSFHRWGNVETEGGGWQEIPYAVRFEGVFRADGHTLPHELRASWWAGTERELTVVDLEIEEATFLP